MIIPWLHRDTEHLVELRAIPNVRDAGKPKSIFTRDADDIETFVSRHDKPGWSVYFGVATRSGQPGTVANCQELPAVWIDVDGAKPVDLVQGAYLPPSLIVDSGNGIHAYWLLNEPFEISEALDNDGHPAVLVMQGLARIFAADRSVADLARIMRLPGTTNSKREPVTCTVLYQSDVRYELDDLAEWVSWQAQLRGEPVDPFLAAAERLGIRSSIDPEEMLAGMEYPGNVHEVQLRVTAHMATAGRPEDEVVEAVLEATKLAAGQEGRRWNWNDERKAIVRMFRDAEKKFAKPVSLEAERRKRAGGSDSVGSKPKQPADEKEHVIRRVAAVTLEVWGRPIIAVEGELYTYEGGVWHAIDQGWEHRLRSCIQGAVHALKLAPNNSTLNGVYRLIHESPDHLRHGIEWDRQGVVVARNGAYRVAEGVIEPHSQEHYATRRIDCDVVPEAGCSKWLAFLEEVMPEGAAEVLREWMGAALIRGKARELSKGVILYGPSRTGKTQVADVVRALLGGGACGLRVKAIGERFGMQPLLNASGWIADDAVSQHEVMDAEAYKVIVTGESVSVERKNKTAMETRFDMPVMLTMNAFPVVKDNSDAVYNRTMVIPMRQVQSEQTAKPIAQTVIQEELPGILNWASEGWRRLAKRGWYELPESMQSAVNEYKSGNNPMQDFVREFVGSDGDKMIFREDLRKAFNGWLKTEVQSRSEWSGKAVAASFQQVMPKVIGDKTHRGRVWVGCAFTNDVLPYINEFGTIERTLADLNHGLPEQLRERSPTYRGRKPVF